MTLLRTNNTDADARITSNMGDINGIFSQVQPSNDIGAGILKHGLCTDKENKIASIAELPYLNSDTLQIRCFYRHQKFSLVLRNPCQ